MDISFKGSTIAFIILALFALIVALIFFLRTQYRNKAEQAIAAGKEEGDLRHSLAARNKYPSVNTFRLSKSVFLFGLVGSLLITVLAFSYTKFEEEIFIPEGALDFEDEIEIELPRTAEPPPPPPPPPPPVIEEVPEEEIEEEDEPIFEDQSIDEETEIDEEPVVEDAPPPPPPPPPPPEPEVDEIFKIVEQKPRFPGCENEAGDNAAKELCAQQKMLKFLYKNIKYPAIAKENGIEGTAVIRFVVEKDGSISDTKIVRDVKGGSGKEALRVVDMMNNMSQKWTPGKQRGRAVRVQYNLPVKFKLE